MSDFHLAMFFCSGWLASILVGVTIDVWRMARRQRLAQAVSTAAEGPDWHGDHGEAPSRRPPAVRPREGTAAAAPLDSLDAVSQSPAG